MTQVQPDDPDSPARKPQSEEQKDEELMKLAEEGSLPWQQQEKEKKAKAAAQQEPGAFKNTNFCYFDTYAYQNDTKILVVGITIRREEGR